MDINSHIDRSRTSCETERLFEWNKWMREIPILEFPTRWKIQIIPPFGGAIIRFRVVTEFGSVSIYLDAYDQLGCMDNKPYWEIYPGSDEDGNPERFWLYETKELLEGIQKSINKMKPKDVL